MFINVSITVQCISVHKGILDHILYQCSGMYLEMHCLSVLINVSLIAQFTSVHECILYCTAHQCLGMYP